LFKLLVRLFGWEDKSYLHAVMHVENAVNNLRGRSCSGKMGDRGK